MGKDGGGGGFNPQTTIREVNMGAVTELRHKDGDGGDESTIEGVSIKPVENGYLVTVTDDENGDLEYVFTNKKDMLKFVAEHV